jgi:hypothetical protein
VIFLGQKVAIFHALTINYVALDRESAQDAGCPLTELCGAYGIDAVADRNDGVEVVEVHSPRNFPLALLLNYPEFPDSCLRHKLLTGKDISQMLADGAYIHCEQLCHQLLRQPQGFVLVAGLYALITGLAGKYQKFGGAVADQRPSATHDASLAQAGRFVCLRVPGIGPVLLSLVIHSVRSNRTR